MTELTEVVLPTLYKVTSTGADQEWTIRVYVPEDDPAVAVIETVYGQVGGKMQTAEQTIRQGKNLGKKNASTAFTQAESQALAKWELQKGKGYTEQGETGRVLPRPMLAATFKPGQAITFPCFAQPKLDGLRCLAENKNGVVTLWSRLGNKIETTPHINAAVAKLTKDGDTLDGELYIHGVAFQEIIKLVKSVKPDTVKVEYHVYDCLGVAPFSERYVVDHLEARELLQGFNTGVVRFVETISIDSHEDITDYQRATLAEDYEGIMLRHGPCFYLSECRSQSLLKVKIWQDAEFLITDVKDGVGKFEGLAIFQCETATGFTFDCVPKGSAAARRKMYADRESSIGKHLTVEFFEWTTSEQSVPRFPKGIAIRDYE